MSVGKPKGTKLTSQIASPACINNAVGSASFPTLKKDSDKYKAASIIQHQWQLQGEGLGMEMRSAAPTEATSGFMERHRETTHPH